MMGKITFYKGCNIFTSKYAPADAPYVWEEDEYGVISEGTFAAIEDAKRDIDAEYPDGGVTVIDGEIYSPAELRAYGL